MASAFGHGALACTFGAIKKFKIKKLKYFSFLVGLSILPDIDVLAFKLGIPYEHMLGHRGFTHSILFALITSISTTILFFNEVPKFKSEFYWLSFFFFLSLISHGFLDALTDGGLGVGFLIPLSSERFFFPWRPIAVSPLTVKAFFTMRGVQIILSELLSIGLISTCILLFNKLFTPKKA